MTLIIRTTGREQYGSAGDGRIKMLVLGAPDAGKTRSASFWPAPIFADCEDGLMSVADRQVPYAPIKSTADMRALLDMLEAECKKPIGQRKYETLVIDTLDAYQRIVIQERLRVTKKTAMAGWDDWGFLDAQMQLIVDRINSLPMNVIVNNHVKDQKIGEGDDAYFASNIRLKGDYRDQIAAEFDLIGFMGTFWEAEDGKRVQKRGIQWKPTPDRPLCRDRSGRLPTTTPVTFTSDDYGNLLERMVGGEELPEGEVLQELEVDEAPAPVTEVASGPVPTKTPRVPKDKPSEGAAKGEVVRTPASGPVKSPPPVPPAVKPVSRPESKPEPEADTTPSAPEPAQTPDVEPETELTNEQHEAAVATVVEELGGEVISDVIEPDAIACGAPRFPDNPDDFVPVQGCGKILDLTFEDGRIVGSSEGVADLIEIAGIKTRTFLCNSCFAAYRTSNKK